MASGTDDSEWLAEVLLRRCAFEHRSPQDAEVLEILRHIHFEHNFNRSYLNQVEAATAESFNLGLAPRAQKLTHDTLNRPFLTAVLTSWGHSQILPPFSFTNIQVNGPNFLTGRHRDRYNLGPSALKALGSFTRGGIYVWHEDNTRELLELLQYSAASLYDPRDWVYFDGRCAHEVDAGDGGTDEGAGWPRAVDDDLFVDG